MTSGGLATSVAQGTATITAASGTITGSATLTVTAAVLASISVTPSHGIGGSRLHTAIHGDGDVQQRHDAEPDQHGDLGIVGDVDRDRKQRRVGDEPGAGNGHDHRGIGDDPAAPPR